MVRTLLKSCGGDRCQVDALDGNGRSPTHWAAMLGKANLCAILIDVGGAVYASSRDDNGATPLHYAVRAGGGTCAGAGAGGAAQGAEETVRTLMKRPKVRGALPI